MSEKPVQVTLFRNGVPVYDRVWKHEELAWTGLTFELNNRFQEGRYLARASVDGVPLAEYKFVMEPNPVGNIFMSDRLFNGSPQRETKVLEHQPGTKQTIYFDVGVSGALPPPGKVVYIALLHNGQYLFNYSNPVTERNWHFMVTHEADFTPGTYTARLSADGEPLAEYSFTVQNIIQETQDEKNRRIGGFVNTVLPGSSGTPLIMGVLRTCESATGWKDFVPRSQFAPGEQLCAYSEALYVNQSGRIDVSFHYRIVDVRGQQLAAGDDRVAAASVSESCWATTKLMLPRESTPGSYTLAVEAKDNLTGRVGSATVQFAITAFHAPGT